MNQNNRLNPSWLLALAATVFLTAPGCGLKKLSSSTSNLNPADTNGGLGSTGIKTAQTLIASLEVVTGIPSTTTTGIGTLSIADHTKLGSAYLSKSTEITGLTNTHILIATALGAHYARMQIHAEIAMPAKSRVLTNMVDFTLAPSKALTDAVVNDLIARFSRRYVQANLNTQEISTIKNCLSDMKSDLGDGSNATANSLIIEKEITACIAAQLLGSPRFLAN